MHRLQWFVPPMSLLLPSFLSTGSKSFKPRRLSIKSFGVQVYITCTGIQVFFKHCSPSVTSTGALIQKHWYPSVKRTGAQVLVEYRDSGSVSTCSLAVTAVLPRCVNNMRCVRLANVHRRSTELEGKYRNNKQDLEKTTKKAVFFLISLYERQPG